jgi:hypothetical protein
MQRVLTYIILIAVFLSGLVLVYRRVFRKPDLIRIEGRVIDRKLEPLYEHKGKNYYALVFTIGDQPVKPAIYNGTASQHFLLNEIIPGNVYTFMMDPEVTTAKEVNLGIREIRSKSNVIYKESNRSSLVAGISLSSIALIAFILIWNYKPRKFTI